MLDSQKQTDQLTAIIYCSSGNNVIKSNIILLAMLWYVQS